MPPFGYIDPGSGSLLLQALLAALLSIPFVFRRTIGGFWQRVRGAERVDDQAPPKVRPPDPPHTGDN